MPRQWPSSWSRTTFEPAVETTNLAVVCDADQVIHCDIDKSAKNKVTYTAGSLENPINNKLTVDVLEGTRPALDHRDSKYQPEP